MAKKYSGRKIKRSHNLYKKKKSKGRKAFELIGMIVLVAGLVFVGYFCGKPLVEFLSGQREEKDVTSLWWTPETSDTEASETIETTSPVVSETPAETTEAAPEPITGVSAKHAPTSALANTAALNAYLKQVKNEGYNAVILELKNEDGNLLYKSSLKSLENCTLATGTLGAAQIKAACDSAGVIPIICLNTLMDKLGAAQINDVSYRWADDSYAWLDNNADNGGKQWADPMRTGTINYISGITEELSKAGFSKIIFKNTVYPVFKPFDETILSKDYFDMSSRYKALTNLVSVSSEKAKKDNGTVMLEMSLKELIENYNGYLGTAELMRAGNTIANNPIVLVYSKSEIGGSIHLNETQAVDLPPDIASSVKYLFDYSKKYTGSLTVIPSIDSAGLSDEELADVIAEFHELGYENYFIR